MSDRWARRGVSMDDGLPEDWGDPADPQPGEPPVWSFGNWRFVVVALRADERVALVRLAHAQHRSTEDMAAALLREGLRRREGDDADR